MTTVLIVTRIYPRIPEVRPTVCKDRETVKTVVGPGDWMQIAPDAWHVYHTYSDTDGKHALVYRVEAVTCL